MRSEKVAGETRRLGEAQGYFGLSVRDEACRDPAQDNAMVASMVTAWRPTADELAELNKGGRVYVRILGTAHPPIHLWAES